MRLDQFLVYKRGVESRAKAQEMVRGGHVRLRKERELVLNKPSFLVDDDTSAFIVVMDNEVSRYVSRAGLKLEGALQHVRLNVGGMTVLDIGQSTGGFTDCLLQMGALSVVGIDVGEDQLHPKIRALRTVRAFEKINARHLAESPLFLAAVPLEKFDLVVCDVSFISLNQVVPNVMNFLKREGHFLFLVKPQFECGPQYLNKNGIVKSEAVYDNIRQSMIALFATNFGSVTSYFESSVRGKDGNREFFIYGKKV